MNKKNILHRMQVNGKGECFATLKDHKASFKDNARTRLINPTKNKIARISKVILQNIKKQLRNKLQLPQWINTTSAINWFKKIKSKNKRKFMLLHIKDFFRAAANTNKNRSNIIQHARKITPLQQRNSVAKRKTPTFLM